MEQSSTSTLLMKAEKPRNWWKIPGFEFSPNTPPVAVEAALEWLRAGETESRITPASPGGYWNNLGNFADFDDEGKLLKADYGMACHAMLGYDNGKRSCVALWMSPRNHDDWIPFRDYFINSSFATEFILGSTDSGVVVSGDAPACVVHSIAMMSRVARMFSAEIFRRFNRLLERGVPADLAYMVTFNISTGGDTTVSFNPIIDHRPWGCPNISGLRNFMNGVLPRIPTRPFRDNRDDQCSYFFSGSTSLSHDLQTDKEFMEILLEYRKKKVTEDYRPPNPFAKGPRAATGNQISVEEVHDVALPYLLNKGVFNEKSE